MGQIGLLNCLLKFLLVIWNYTTMQIIHITYEYLINTITNVKLQKLKPFNYEQTWLISNRIMCLMAIIETI